MYYVDFPIKGLHLTPQQVSVVGSAVQHGQHAPESGDLTTPEGTIVITYEEEDVPEEIASNAAEQILDYKRSHPDWHGPKAAKGRTA